MTTTPEPPKPPAPLDDLYKKFLSSPHHAAMGLLTLGVGILSGMPLVLIAGGVAYALGWIYLPGMPLFTKWIKKWEEEARLAEEQRQIDAFNVRRSAILSSLSADQQQRYVVLASVCHDIEKAGAERRLVSGGAEEADPRLRKLDDLMWTFLRLLSFSQSLEQYLALEEREDFPGSWRPPRRTSPPCSRSWRPRRSQTPRISKPSSGCSIPAPSFMMCSTNAASGSARPVPTSPWPIRSWDGWNSRSS
jgi:hypothetical protein